MTIAVRLATYFIKALAAVVLGFVGLIVFFAVVFLLSAMIMLVVG